MKTEKSSNGGPEQKAEEEEDADEDEDDEQDEDEEDEPRLKYTSLTKNLRPLYRNGDATSAFLVAGDKMIIGTHNGNIHVLSLPLFKSIRVYHAHSASISALSISPFPPPAPVTRVEAVNRIASEHRSSPAQSPSSAKDGSPSARGPKQTPVPITASNSIHIGSSSIDGNVCVASLVDQKDVLLRNFGRPVQSVAMSPDYKNDRSYLSGGLAGNLILSSGGRSGTSSTSNTTSATASASGWLGSIGLGSNTGKDLVLHSGEGAISTIKWSLSGMYVVWVNEQGIKIMRSNLHLEAGEKDFSWKRISHTDRPGWDEMAGVWKPHVEWIDEDGLESDDHYGDDKVNGIQETPQTPQAGLLSVRNPLRSTPKARRIEKLVVGWSGTIWIMDVHPGGAGTGNEAGERKAGRVEMVNILRTDCIISGISLYTPNLLVVLAYVTPEEETSSSQTTTRRGVHRRQNALQPEMRIIDIRTKEEVSVADTLNVSRFEGLSATDYHLGVLPAMRLATKAIPTRGALEVIGVGLWDATMYPTRLFSSAASVRSAGSHSGTGSSSKAPSDANTATGVPINEDNVPDPATLTYGMKIFIHSPYDCVLATKISLSDHFSWLINHALYEEAWNLVDHRPEVVGALGEETLDSLPGTPTKAQGDLVDFFADDSSQTTSSPPRNFNSQAEKEKRHIGEKWLQQLVSAKNWEKAGQICGKVLGTSSRWEHWVWIFAEAKKYEEITPYIPTTQLRPPLPSVVYEIILGHYISVDRIRFQELLQRWPPELFDAGSIIEAIQARLRGGDIREDSTEDGETGRDWRILMHSLAILYVAHGRPRQALGCFILLQDADAAMALIAESHLIDAISDDIPGFILLRVSKEQQKSAALAELESATLEPIRLLVDEAHHGIVRPETVISQLQQHGNMQRYLFFYFRALWNGNTTASATLPTASPRIARPSSILPDTSTAHLAASEGKSLVSDHADLAVSLFAEYDRPLLMNFLKTSQSYTLSSASAVCKQRGYIPEWVYLLSKEGRTAQALRLIIDHLNDVSQAIAFAKEQDDQSLWDDLLDYSMNKPRFIRALLEEVGTAINPIKLVRRIPAGLEIEGLREGLSRMIREYEVQHSISLGVARVLRGEVAAAMAKRGNGQRKGVKFDVVHNRPHTQNARPQNQQHGAQSQEQHGGTAGAAAEGSKALETAPPRPAGKIKPGHCPGCGKPFADDATQLLIGFACGHVFHLSCLLKYDKPNDGDEVEIPDVVAQMGESSWPAADNYDRSVGPKVDRAALLRTLIGDGCPMAVHKNGE